MYKNKFRLECANSAWGTNSRSFEEVDVEPEKPP